MRIKIPGKTVKHGLAMWLFSFGANFGLSEKAIKHCMYENTT
ncbi:MAG: hypothetical protein KatS3mg031_0486 [Chitinophagales bacterium]|nr:MAG: hypothetical protein KatS3mg031_0486 [Chitinophagales bacterium]